MEDKFQKQRIEWYNHTENVNCVGFLLRFTWEESIFTNNLLII